MIAPASPDKPELRIADKQPENKPLRAERLAPHSIEMEESALGAVLFNDYVFEIVAGILEPADFFFERHRLIFEAMAAMHKREDAIVPETLEVELKARGILETIGGYSYLTRLMNNTPSWVHARTYAFIVKRAAQRRKLIATAAEIAQLAQSDEMALPEIVDKVNQLVSKAVKMPAPNTSMSIGKAIGLVYAEADDAMQGVVSSAIPSGYKMLDQLLSGGGFEPGRLYLVAGRPGHGKTALLTDISRVKAKEGRKVFDESLEMPIKEVARRMAAQELSIPSDILKSGKLTPDQWTRFTAFMAASEKWALTVDSAPGITVTELCVKIRQIHAERGLDLACIDYLQLIETPGVDGENRVLAIGDISRKLKLLAMELNIPIICAAQLNRQVESRADKRPQLSDLRESGSLEQDADVVIAMYRDIEYNAETTNPNAVELIVRKNRDGSKGTAHLYYNAACSWFGTLETRTIDPPVIRHWQDSDR